MVGRYMAMKQINLWQDKTEVKRGNIGEKLVKDYLESLGCIIYEPVTDGSHLFDKLVLHPTRKLFICEVKTKPARLKYPDTGVDIRHYNSYKSVMNNYKLDVLLVFVDDLNRSMYGNWLSELDKPFGDYPLKHKGIIYWHINTMRILRELTDSECRAIRLYYTGNY